MIKNAFCSISELTRVQTVSNRVQLRGAWGVSRVPVYRHGHGRARTLARKPCPNGWTRPSEKSAQK
jgi:hypothetical protein